MLLLFDIDGTLLQGASKVHAEALHFGLHEVYGVRDSQAVKVDMAGRTDMEIARRILVALGVSARRIDEGLDDFREAACEEYARICPDSLGQHLVPGIDALLGSLEGREEVLLALVTGNLEPIARLKLARAGIGTHFPSEMGGFGSDSEDRAELPAIARRRAGRWLSLRGESAEQRPYARSRTVVIGDTPRDIACAQADGVACVAVCTGPYDAEQLVAADAVAHDTGELGAALERMIGAGAASAGSQLAER
jgi:phosphoglycolate phosphatase-like HAD superfamily hydrolase